MIINDNKLKYKVLEKIIRPYFELRKINPGSDIIYDTLIVYEKDSEKRKKIIKILNSLGFGTKNLPDAMEWHCTFYWDHALDKKEITKSKKKLQYIVQMYCYSYLKKKNITTYRMLGKKTNKIVMKNLIIVPARENSKRLPGKNFTKLNGKPLIDYTVNICKKLNRYGDVFISTDSNKIIKHYRKKSFLKIQKRNQRLSSGKAKIIDVILDLIKKINPEKEYENVILLQPTSPLRKASDVIKCIKIFKNKKLMSLATISKIKVNTSELINEKVEN